MPKLPVLSAKGRKIDEVEVGSVFEQKENLSLLHQVVRSYLAQVRKGTACTKTRGEVRGGGAKPWKQKGTGRARAGSIRSPLWKGGGTTFGPHPRNYSLSLSKKMRKAALRSALWLKTRNSELIVVDRLKFKKPKTKEALKVLQKVKALGKTTVVVTKRDENAFKSIRNIPEAKAINVSEINPYHILDNQTLVFTREALEHLLEVVKG